MALITSRFTGSDAATAAHWRRQLDQLGERLAHVASGGRDAKGPRGAALVAYKLPK